MIKQFKNSRIEIWSARYINKLCFRTAEDREMIIQQIESAGDGDYIVEITEPDDGEEVKT